MDILPDNLSEEDFVKLSELHEKYDNACDLVRYHKMMNYSVDVIIPLMENMEQTKKELNDFQKDDLHITL